MDWSSFVTIAGVWLAIIALAGFRRVRVFGPTEPKCAACQYDLAGLEERAVCPECGSGMRVAREMRAKWTRCRMRCAIRFALMIVPFALFVLWAPVLSYATFRLSGVQHRASINRVTDYVYGGTHAAFTETIPFQLAMGLAPVLAAAYVAVWRGGRVAAWFVLASALILYSWVALDMWIDYAESGWGRVAPDWTNRAGEVIRMNALATVAGAVVCVLVCRRRRGTTLTLGDEGCGLKDVQ